MAIGFLGALKLLPWSDIVTSAPVVVDGAKKLWEAVSRKKIDAEKDVDVVPPEFSGDARAIKELDFRFTSAERIILDLENEMISSSNLINELASQNSSLIQHMDCLNKRFRLLAIYVGILSIAVGAFIVFQLFFKNI